MTDVTIHPLVGDFSREPYGELISKPGDLPGLLPCRICRQDPFKVRPGVVNCASGCFGESYFEEWNKLNKVPHRIPNLVIVRGLPGSGKSTLARAFGSYHVEADMFHMRSGVYTYEAELASEAHAWCLSAVRNALIAGVDTIVSNTFTTLKSMEPYWNLADEGIAFNLHVHCMKLRLKGVHNVSEEAVDRMRAEWEAFEGEIIHE